MRCLLQHVVAYGGFDEGDGADAGEGDFKGCVVLVVRYEKYMLGIVFYLLDIFNKY